MLRCCSLIICLLANAAWADDVPEVTREQREFFEKSVRPVLVENCHKCHGPKQQKGELRLDSRAGMLKGGQTGPAIVPGKPEESELVLAVSYDPSGYQMPPTGKLNADQISSLTEWIKMGAPWPEDPAATTKPDQNAGIDLAERAKHWSFQPVMRQEIPKTQNPDWPRNPIDAFILHRLEAAKLGPASPASKRTWLRRVTYDLTGLPPTPEETQRFLSDKSPDAYEKVVERLLSSPSYGERWARHWLDLVRFAETSGHEFDYEIEHAALYRDYVVRALNADVSYDQFVTEHIAGDLLQEPRRHPVTGTNESIIGTGFYWFGQGKHSPVDLLAEECDTIDNQLDVLGKTFLGLTIACARCHDHKFDPITTEDYYAMTGYLQSSRRQYAFIDPPERVESLITELQEAQKARSRILSQVVHRELNRGNDFIDQILKATDEAAGKDPSHPLYAWAVLSSVNDANEFQSAKAQLIRQMSELQQAANSKDVFADSTKESLKDWSQAGHAFQRGLASSGSIITDNNRLELAAPRAINSGNVSGRLKGELRSPTFQISNRYIHYRMRRVGGPANPGRGTKNGQVHLIVDGFHFIKDPLYGQLSINVEKDAAFRWYRQDLEKFQGKGAYIEVQDDDEGHLIIDRILFSDEAPPPEPPNTLVLGLLSQTDITSPQDLRAGYVQLFQKVLNQWDADQWELPAQARDGIAILNAMLDAVSLSMQLTKEESAEFNALTERLSQLEALLPEPRRAIAMTDGTGENAHVLIRGNSTKPGSLVPRRFLQVFQEETQLTPAEGSGRLELARQITDPDNPLTARVLVNRLWLHHFGRGLVPTPDDFGKMGTPPSHPELLDWLAAEFVESGWSIKHIHRLMVLSNTYRMTSRLEPHSQLATSDLDPEAVDPNNLLLHRMPVRRLEAEAIRDAVLAVSGRLELRMEGQSVPPYLTPFMEGRGRPAQSGPLDGAGRRSLYINVRRNFLTPMFLAFDYPTPFSTMGRRSVSNVPAQGLTMMNNPFILEQARVWADCVLAEKHASPESRVQELYELAYARPATKAELTAALKFLETQGQDYSGPNDPRTWADLCHVLFNVKEFLFIE